MPQTVYLDHNATTPVAPEVVEAMAAALRECYGNPSSAYPLGRAAAERVAGARQAVAALVGAGAENLVFTGCATEANNLALLGVAAACPPEKRHLVISAVEHPSVMAPARHLEAQGWALTVVPVDGTGRVSVDAVAGAVRHETALVSVMLANNEVGTLQPVAEIAGRLRGSGVLLHTDAAQAVGKIAVNVDELGADLLTLAGHKFQASKGIGALYIRQGTPLRQIVFGAGHERGLRPGTENVPAIVGLGVAADLAAPRQAPGEYHQTERPDALHRLLSAAL
ncbi:MAG: cysteine desulfurase, partial [Ectothiorhodospiraceae bacterium]|nr:cysteine desulfurase [Ectothiorhodospiraceae bacterium]